MRPQPSEPVELVIEFRPGLRIAVRQIDAGDDDAVDGGLDIARLVIIAIAGQRGSGQYRLGVARQDGDAVPGLLSAPHRAVAGFLDRQNRELGIGRFQFLQTDDFGFSRAQPAQQVRQAAVDIIDVEGRDLHVELAGITMLRLTFAFGSMSKLRFAIRARHRMLRTALLKPPTSAAPARRTMTNIAPVRRPAAAASSHV